MEKYNLTYQSLGEEVLLIEWPSQIEASVLFDILSFQKVIEERLGSQIEEIQNTYVTLAIFFNPDKISYPTLVSKIKDCRSQSSGRSSFLKSTVWEIPVCYGLQFGIDLEAMSVEKKLSIEQIIALHSENIYTVYFTGFLPGFLYLGGLNEKLYMPRKQIPRAVIPKGAVAIGGSQTGIYPQVSPGGWNIIGNTPVPMFQVKEAQPCKIQAGDKIKFLPISDVEHKELIEKIKARTFELKQHPYALN